MGHGHGHGHAHSGPTPERALQVALLVNATFLVVEAVAGWWTNSLALLSDAGHMVSDVGALTLAWVAIHIRAARPSPAFTFGLRRAPVIGGLVNSTSLLAIVVLIVLEAVERLDDPPRLQPGPVIVVGVLGLLVNAGSAAYLAASRDRSVNTRGALAHLMADALGSLAAIGAGIAVAVGDYRLADPIASLVIAFFIGVGILPLLRDTLRILLQVAPSQVDVVAVRGALEEHASVEAVEDLHVWALDDGQPVLSAVLVVALERLVDANRLVDDTRGKLRERFDIRHATLECRQFGAGESDPSWLDCGS